MERKRQLPWYLRLLGHFPRLWALWIWCHGPKWRAWAMAYAQWLLAQREV